ncbi:glucosyltransferase domain-containing protein [Pseudomonas rhodesiae]|uniref:glucosyltransferase domain-containing protein n=1 Tax=Pseudomonas rhodesiae TaxID=76760 RepID=UPI002735937C|nr:glucosyltransferase domain-containing protein [Pseudomonas rhodesiae]WLG42104.1 glucosyltransferase domain-containing protein [Pseudomonas rhodesiae]
MLNQKRLSRNEVTLVFMVLSFVYIYPLVHADYAYIDDNWRALHQAQDAWRNQGRILLEVLHRFLTFTGGTTNIFPLPLLMSVFALALAMTRLTLWYFARPCIFSCLVVLPVLCNPFFLGNLTYQFDGPGMVFAVVAIIYALTCGVEHAICRSLVSALLIAVSLSLYQPTLTLFVGLAIVEYVCGVKNRMSTREALSLVAQRIAQLIVGCLIYALTAYQMAVDRRGDFSVFDAGWFEVAGQKLFFAMEQVYLLINSGAIFFYCLFIGWRSVGVCIFHEEYF